MISHEWVERSELHPSDHQLLRAGAKKPANIRPDKWNSKQVKVQHSYSRVNHTNIYYTCTYTALYTTGSYFIVKYHQQWVYCFATYFIWNFLISNFTHTNGLGLSQLLRRLCMLKKQTVKCHNVATCVAYTLEKKSVKETGIVCYMLT